MAFERMSPIYLILIIKIVLLCNLVCANNPSVHKRFEYKYSFKPPYLAQKDGTVPFWEYGGNATKFVFVDHKKFVRSIHVRSFFMSKNGTKIRFLNEYDREKAIEFDFDAIASGESVRLAPSLRSQKGAIWGKQPINFDWWEVDVMFKVTGRGRIGADGLAFWYVSNRGEYTGEVFGSSDRWNGLAVIFDSFDNDNKHNNPYIMAIVNDGTKSFDHKSDGSTQQLSGCLRDFRNKQFPTRARIEYYLNTLTVYFHNGMTNNEADYELCFRAENVYLPRGGYFGVSAATGGLADDHDVIHFLTSSLHVQQQQGGQQISSDEQARLSQEYSAYQEKLEMQKEEYRKEHPDELREKDDMDDWFESDGQRELRQIFQGQGQIHDILRDLNKKIDEVIGKQMNALSMLTAVYSHAQGQPMPQGQMPAQVGGAIGSNELNMLMANHQLIINTIAELKGFVIEVSRKSDTLLASGGQAGGGVNPQFLNDLRDSVNHVKATVGAVAQRITAQQPGAASMQACPNVSCVTLTSVCVLLAIQLTIMFLYAMYKERKEAQAKKFF